MSFRKDKVESKFIRIAQEHEIVLDYLEKLKSMLNLAPRDRLQKLREMLPVFKSDMRHHFQIEERFLFPAALLAMPSVELVDRVLMLQKEHGYTERDMDILEKMVENEPEETEAIFQLMSDIIEDTERHAKIEMDDIFPKMDADKKCQKIISGIILEP
ncbi:hemerythrin domain-containing protein [bacterium]|nr:hemerythrin domain-containing protein [bacterium]